jgi:hypothetical protein
VAVTEPGDAGIAAAQNALGRVTATPLDVWSVDGRRDRRRGAADGERARYQIHPRMPRLAQLVRDASAADYFEILGLCVNDPAFTPRTDSVAEREVLERLAMLGLAKGRTFEFYSLDGLTRELIEEGYRQGRAAVEQAFLASAVDMNGWALERNQGPFGSDFLARAVAAGFAWARAGVRSESLAFQVVDSERRPLIGSHRYALTFDAGDLPPVRTRWELEIGDVDGGAVENEAGRHALHGGGLERGELQAAGGQWVVSIQREPPADPAQRANWLPAPPGAFRVTARFYGPYSALADGSYAMPPVVRTA